jgi:hypothetical protein
MPVPKPTVEPNQAHSIAAFSNFTELTPEQQDIEGIHDYNYSFIQAMIKNGQGRIPSLPAVALWVRFSLVFGTGNNQTIFNVYPNDPSKNIIINYGVYENTEESKVNLSYSVVKKLWLKDRFNFLRQVDVQYAAAEGGDVVHVNLYDPTGSIIEEAVVNSILKQTYTVQAGCNLVLEYGWQDSKEGVSDTRQLAGTGMTYILSGLDVTADYFGNTYVLTFTDVASTLLNTRPPGFTKDTSLGNGSKDKISFPQALKLYAEKMLACNKLGKTKVYLLVGGPPVPNSAGINEGSSNLLGLSKEACDSGAGWTKEENRKEPANWGVGDQTFIEWLDSQLKELSDDAKHKYKRVFVQAGHTLPGKPSDYYYFDGTWKTPPSQSSGDRYWTTTNNPEGENVYVWITRDILADIATAKDEGGKKEDMEAIGLDESLAHMIVLKKYKWLSTDKKDPHNTVIRLTVDTSNVLGWYLTRLDPQDTLSTDDATSEDAKKKTTDGPKLEGANSKASDNTDNPEAAYEKDCTAGGKSVNSPGSATNPTTQGQQGPAKETGIVEASASMIGLKLQVEVVGDPELKKVLYGCVQIDFANEGNVLLPWLKGTYSVTALSDSIAEGIWTSSMSLIKLGGLKPNSKTADAMRQVATRSTDINNVSTAPPRPLAGMSVSGGQSSGAGGLSNVLVQLAAVVRSAASASVTADYLDQVPATQDIYNTFRAVTGNSGSASAPRNQDSGFPLNPATYANGVAGFNSRVGPSATSPGGVATGSTAAKSQASAFSLQNSLDIGTQNLYSAFGSSYINKIPNYDDRLFASQMAFKYGINSVNRVFNSMSLTTDPITGKYTNYSPDTFWSLYQNEIAKVEYGTFGPYDIRMQGLSNYKTALDNLRSSS